MKKYRIVFWLAHGMGLIMIGIGLYFQLSSASLRPEGYASPKWEQYSFNAICCFWATMTILWFHNLVNNRPDQ